MYHLSLHLVSLTFLLLKGLTSVLTATQVTLAVAVAVS